MSAIRLLYKKIFFFLLELAPILLYAAGHESGNLPGELEKNKEIPKEYRQPILTALSYFPELNTAHIIFRVKKAYTPLSTKPNIAGIFKRKDHRTYIITISNQTVDTLSRLLFQNLTFEEQVGIIGHELSHVVDFNRKNFFQTVGNGISHISKKFVDRMEFNTDRICIMHGLGKYLEEYSMHVRQSMHVHYWRGVDNVYVTDKTHERYMNPETIEKYMSTLPSHLFLDRCQSPDIVKSGL